MSKVRYLSDDEWSIVYLVGMLTLIPLLISSVILFPEVNGIYFFYNFLILEDTASKFHFRKLGRCG